MTAWQAVVRTDNKLTTDSEALNAELGRFGATASPRAIPQSALILDAIAKIRMAWRWVERKRAMQLTSRRLRVAETISLGDKRFVSILQVDGAQFLIGGSATSVQLLACLDKVTPQGENQALCQPEVTR